MSNYSREFMAPGPNGYEFYDIVGEVVEGHKVKRFLVYTNNGYLKVMRPMYGHFGEAVGEKFEDWDWQFLDFDLE